VVSITSLLEGIKIEHIINLLLTIFAVFLLVQIFRQILGGSWSTEDIIVGLLIFNLGAIFTIGLMVAQLKADHNHLKSQFQSLANDFKTGIKKR